MGHTRKAVEVLIEGLSSGRIQLTREVADGLEPLLANVRRDEAGRIILATCSGELRAIARASMSAMLALSGDADSDDSNEPEPPIVDVVAYTRELFYRLNALFIEQTGKRPEQFAPDGDFGGGIRRLAKELQDPVRYRDMADATERAFGNLVEFYRSQAAGVPRAAAALGGTKLVLGGKQSFSGSSFDAVRSMALYADTILIPDPVFRWLEVDSTQERFARVRMIEDIWWLLKLRPLVDAGIPVPPIVLFPSYEKVLEQRDETTQFGIEAECVQVFSHVLGVHFDELAEVIHHANAHPDEVLSMIEKRGLFVALGGDIGMDIRKALPLHKRQLERLRSDVFLEQARSVPDAQLVCASIVERLAPLYHLNENASSLRAAPLMGHRVHWHYARIRREACRAHIREEGVDEKTLTLLETLENGPKAWLGNVPMPDLVRLRGEGANRAFRERMAGMMSRLSEPDTTNVGRVAGEVAHEFRSIVAEHEAEVRRIDERGRTALAAAGAATFVSAAASFLPWFPSVGAAATIAAAASALAAQQAQARTEKRHLGRTLVGVLAAAAREKRAS